MSAREIAVKIAERLFNGLFREELADRLELKYKVSATEEVAGGGWCIEANQGFGLTTPPVRGLGEGGGDEGHTENNRRPASAIPSEVVCSSHLRRTCGDSSVVR